VLKLWLYRAFARIRICSSYEWATCFKWHSAMPNLITLQLHIPSKEQRSPFFMHSVVHIGQKLQE